MRIDFAKLEAAGYTIDQDSNEYGDVTCIFIMGNDPAPIGQVHEVLIAAFPHVHPDQLAGAAHEAVSTAQGMDIIRICK